MAGRGEELGEIVHSGIDGTDPETFLGRIGGDQSGFRVQGGGDVNGDGQVDVADLVAVILTW